MKLFKLKKESKSFIAVLLGLAMVISMTPTVYSGASATNSSNSSTLGAEDATGSAVTTEPATSSATTTAAVEKTYPYTDYIFTEKELEAAGTTWTGSSSVMVYVHISSATSTSYINAQSFLGSSDTTIGKTSSKYLVGSGVTAKQGNYIQDGVVGKAGSGNYAFQSVNLNSTDSSKNALSDEAKTHVTIKLISMTNDVTYEILGMVFSNGSTYPEGFTAPTNLESTTLDSASTPSPSATASMTYKQKLFNAISYCKNLDVTKYTAESQQTLATAITTAQTAYDLSTGTETTYSEAYAALEKTKASLLFVSEADDTNAQIYKDLTNDEIIDEMGAGINLGNTLDGHSGLTPSEVSWQNVVTTKKYIKALHDAGFNTVRIPVTWGTMIDDSNGYKISEKWISRVQDIVDYCVSQDMYAIINIHHDGADLAGWINLSLDDMDSVYNEYECVWRNIAEYFKNYDEHLIFESMNEVSCMEGDTKNSAAAIAYDTPLICNLNQIFVNVVRSTGSNNAKRWLACVSHYANGGTQSGFSLPTDSYNTTNNRLMFAAHIYKASTNVSWTYDEVYQVVSGLKNMASKFDVPMYLGEYGTRTYADSSKASGYNDQARAYFSEIVNKACQVAGCVPIVWDQGVNESGDIKVKSKGCFTYWDRGNCTPLFDDIIEAMMRGSLIEPSEKNKKWDFTDITLVTTPTAITKIVPEKTSVTIESGKQTTLSASVEPAENEDVLLWSTDDDSIVTVYNGLIQAKRAGTTYVHVYSQSGDQTESIKVTVKASTTSLSSSVSEIKTDADEYSLSVGSTKTLGVTTVDADLQNQLFYNTSDATVLTVNSLGKMVGISEGIAYVTISASTGVSKTVKVNVSPVVSSGSCPVGVYILYNDKTSKYYGTELGDTVEINKNGQYTVSFDISSDLSNSAKKLGVSSVNNITAIYLKDINVMNGDATKSCIKSCGITYDSFVINDTTNLTINHTTADNPINSSGVFDSGEPVNSYSGSYLNEVSSSNFVATFNTEAVTKFTLTFTISDIAFNEATVINDEKAATGITPVSGAESDLTSNTAEAIKIKVTPADTDSKFYVTSSDTSIIEIADSQNTYTVDEDGYITINTLTGNTGNATLTVYSNSGLSLVYKISVVSNNATSTPDATVSPTATTDVTNTTNPGASATPGTTSSASTNSAVSGQAVTTPTTAPFEMTSGTSFQTGGIKYKVISASKKTAKVIGVSDKKLKKITIPSKAKLSLDGQSFSFKITSINKNAFKNNKTITSLTVGANVTSIGSTAFNNCSKLKKIVIKSKKITSFGKNCFKGINKKAVIYVNKSVYSKYKKLLKSKAGLKSSVKIKKL